MSITTVTLLRALTGVNGLANLEMSGHSIPIRVDSIESNPFKGIQFSCRALSQEARKIVPKNELKPARVIFNPPATIVYWEDGRKTVVKCSENDEFDQTMGLAMAMCKKMYGNTGCYNDIFRKFVNILPTDNDAPKIGDQIRFELKNHIPITATVQKITDTEIIYMTDDCVMESKMNGNNTNAGGYNDSWLRVEMESLKMRFPDGLRDKITIIAPPTYGQIFGHDERYETVLEPDNDEQFELMKIRKNRLADYKNNYALYWLKNSTKKNVSDSDFAAVNETGYCHYANAAYSRGVRVVFHVKK